MSLPRTDLAIWPAAANAALLGTDRTALAVPPDDGPLGVACTGLVGDGADPPASLLRIAAAASAYRRCGWLPARTEEPPLGVCSADSRPPSSPAAATLLRRILQGDHESLLGAWLALAARHRVRAPADTLTDLLDYGRRDPRLRSRIVDAGGTRAVWLAGFNQEWSYAVAGADPDALVATFEAGVGPARLAALQQLRLLDPERARTEVETSWSQEGPAERAGFVSAFIHGLSAADEPFLERALDDRRKEVRQEASALLARLASSALVARMTTRATGLMSLGRAGLFKRTRIDVSPPTAVDAALVRDGVDPKPPAGTGIGERAWWLAQIVGTVSPSTWISTWSLEPAAVLHAADGNEWRESLVAGWLIATERHRDTAWAAALWENERVADMGPQWRAPSPERVFTTVLPAEQVDAELRRTIEAGHDVLRGSHRVLATILEWPHEWSDTLARTIADRLKELAGDRRAQLTAEFGVRALLERSAHAVPVSAIDAFLVGWPEHTDVWPSWAPTIDALASVLQFRNDLHLAFTQ
jgi:hypothetical protein